MELKIKAAYFANRLGKIYGTIFFIICSCLASLISGIIIFRNRKISKLKFAMFGLCNFLTLMGFSIAAYISKIDTRFTESQGTQPNKKTALGKIIRITLPVASIILLLLIKLLFGKLRYWNFEMIVPTLLVYTIISLFLAPLLWGYYNNRKILAFTALFSILFMALTVVSQLLLTAII